MKNVAWMILALSAVLTPAQAQAPRNPWTRLQQMDEDRDGKVSRREFVGPVPLFLRLDRDGDGFITREEAQSAPGAARPGPNPGGRMEPGRPGGLIWQRLNQDRDEKISTEEWADFFKKADENGDGAIDPAEWEAVWRKAPVKDPAPAEGSRVPQVKARLLEDDREVDLSQARRLTVLIFGSYT